MLSCIVVWGRVFWRVAVCSSALQCVVKFVAACVAACIAECAEGSCSELQCVAMC